MRKFLTIFAGTLITGSVLAGGLVTNNNQSAMFTRLQNRNASTGIDAVYYNPAGLTKLGNGFFVSINNQIIGQTQTVRNNYPYLSGTSSGTTYREYIGKINAPFFPGLYAAYNTGKFSFSFGFNPVGGGGGAKYDIGLPSFEMKIADLVPSIYSKLAPLDAGILAATGNDPHFSNITGYNADIFFEGSSIFFGYQANVAYKINDIFSVAIGGRYVTAKNTYSGYIKNVTITAPAGYGGTQAPGTYLRTVASAISGFSPTNATVLNGTATYLDDATTVEADAEMTGTGFTPIVSVNIAPGDKINLSLKYEFKTNLDLTTTVNDGKDAEGMFIQDSVAISDIPAIFSVGIDLKPIDKLTLSGSFNYYFDKNVDYDGRADVEVYKIDKNFLEFGLGAEYGINEKLRLSAGWVSTITSANSDYQNDMGYSTNANTFGAGFGYRVTPNIDLNLGGQYTLYAEDTKSFPRNLKTITETYNKKTWVVGMGLDFTFGKTE